MACKFPVRARAPLAMLLWQNVVAKIDGPFVHTDATNFAARGSGAVSRAWIAAAWSSILGGPAPGRTDRVVPRVVRDASVLRRALFPKNGISCPQLCPRRRDADPAALTRRVEAARMKGRTLARAAQQTYPALFFFFLAGGGRRTP